MCHTKEGEQYKKEGNNKWTYDHTDYLMINLETIIALAFMTCLVD